MSKWVVCPRCLDAFQGEVGEPCIVCGTAVVDTPLFKNAQKEISNVTSTWLTIVWGES